MLKIIGIIIVVAIIGVLIAAAMQPDNFKIERSIAIKAPPEKVIANVDNFKAWGAWSPWEKKDPAMKRTFGGPERGTGSTYAWEGNKDVGSGRMEITDEVVPSQVTIRLDFLKPMETTSTAQFKFAAQGDTTTVTWAMFGKANFLSKVMCLFFSMDKMVGPDFEAGLASLKSVAEK